MNAGDAGDAKGASTKYDYSIRVSVEKNDNDKILVLKYFL